MSINGGSLFSKIGSVLRTAESRCYFKAFALSRARLLSRYNFGDEFQRVYHFHVRKTGGTSINHSFLSLGGEPAEKVYSRLATSRRRVTQSGDRVFVGWDRVAIETGAYFYAFSHHPKYSLTLPPGTFTISCLRDPVARVLSHYRMLVEYNRQGHDQPGHLYDGELDWVAGGFGEFLERIPTPHLCNQISMFSERLSPEEAADNAATCNLILKSENLDQGFRELSDALHLDLRACHTRRSREIPVDETDIAALREMLAPEYRFLEALAKARPDFAAQDNNE